MDNGENVLLQEIQRLVALMTSDHISHADVYDYNKSKHQIISNSRNIFLFINILKKSESLPNQVVLEILNLIYRLLIINQTSYNLDFILSELTQFKTEEIPLIQPLAKSISYISELIFLSEKRMVLPMSDEKNTITPLESFVFEDFLNCFSELCIQNSDKDIENKFKNNLIQVFVRFGIRLLPNQPLQAVSILKASLYFGVGDKLKKIYTKKVLNFFNPPEIFQCLAQITTNGPEEAALDCLQIVTILTHACDNWDSSISPVVENTQKFILAILSDPAILNDKARTIGIQNLLVCINPEAKSHPYDGVVDFLYNFSQDVLQKDPLQLTIIYPGILSLFRAFKGSQSPPEFVVHFKEQLQPCLIQYSELLLNLFDENAQQASEQIFEIQNLSQINESLKRLLEFSNFESIPPYVRDKTLTFLSNEVTVINSYKLSFILIVLNVCYEKFDIFNEESKAFLFDLLFQIFPLMQEKLPQYSQLSVSTSTPFCIVVFFVQVIETFLLDNFINIKQSRSFDESFIHLCDNSNISEIIPTIFRVLLFMMQNDLGVRPTSIVMRKILERDDLCQILDETDLPNYFIDNYSSLPYHEIYYYTLIKLVYNDPNKREAFLQNLTAHLTQLITKPPDGQIDEETQSNNVWRFFEIIYAFLDSSPNAAEWYALSEFMFDNFGEVIKSLSNSVYWKYVLEILSKLTETKDGEKRLPKSNESFPTTSPFTFEIFKFFTCLLTNILMNINVHQIAVDESIFLSAVPTSDVYLSAIQVFNDHEDGDWDSVSMNIRVMNCFMKSPFPNFDIMKYYQDPCLLDYFNALIVQIQKTSPVSLLSLPNVFDPLIEFISLFIEYYSQIILPNQPFVSFILHITKVAFLSNNLKTLKNNCFILERLCRDISILGNFQMKQPFQQHYVLALNLLTLQKSADVFVDDSMFNAMKEDAASFIYSFLAGQTDFARHINQLLFDGIPQIDQMNDLVTTLNNLIDLPHFNGNNHDDDLFRRSVNDFLLAAAAYSLRLDYIPSMSQFFIFK